MHIVIALSTSKCRDKSPLDYYLHLCIMIQTQTSHNHPDIFIIWQAGAEVAFTDFGLEEDGYKGESSRVEARNLVNGKMLHFGRVRTGGSVDAGSLADARTRITYSTQNTLDWVKPKVSRFRRSS